MEPAFEVRLSLGNGVEAATIKSLAVSISSGKKSTSHKYSIKDECAARR